MSRSRHGRGFPTGMKWAPIINVWRPRRIQVWPYDLENCFKHGFTQQHFYFVSFTHVAYRGVGRADARRAHAPSSLGGYYLIKAVAGAFQILLAS
jgi:hypothetical protein